MHKIFLKKFSLKSNLFEVISSTVVCFKNAISPDSTKHRRAPSNPKYGSALEHQSPGVFPIHNLHSLSELSPAKTNDI
jgi:hypothetical protein